METTNNIFLVAMALLTVSYILIGGYILSRKGNRFKYAIAKFVGILILTVFSAVMFFMIVDIFFENFARLRAEVQMICFGVWIFVTFMMALYWSDQLKNARFLNRTK